MTPSSLKTLNFLLRSPCAPKPEPPTVPARPGGRMPSKTMCLALTQASALLPKATIKISNGSLKASGIFRDPLHLDQLDLDLQLPPEQLTIDLDCRSNIWSNLRLTGSLQAENLQGRLELAIGQFSPALFGPHVPGTSWQWGSEAWTIHCALDLKKPDHADGVLRLTIPALQLQGDQKKAVSVENIQLKAAMTASPDGIQVNLENMQAAQPALSLNGRGGFSARENTFLVELAGRHLMIDPIRAAVLALAGDDETVAGIFDVLRGGKVPWIRFRTQGKTADEMGTFHNMTITGVVEDGRLFIPEADLDLTAVNGRADIAKGILEGSDLRAAYGQTTGSGGELWLDLDQDDEVPFFLDIEVDADLAPLPSLLERWVDDPTFKGEMRRIQSARGSAEGTLVLDGRGPDIDVTVDVTRCQLDAQYERLPAKLSIADGMVQYTTDRIQVVRMKGKLGTSSFSEITGHVAFGETALVQIDNAAGRIDTSAVLPWMSDLGAFENLPFTPASEEGWLALDRLKLAGPLLTPSQWQFAAQGSARLIQLLSPDLPGPAEIETARFLADRTTLEIPESRIRMTDADLSINNTRFNFGNDGLEALTTTISGTLGPVSENWACENIAFDRRLRFKTPVTLTDSTITWTAEGRKTFLGQITTGGGTALTIDLLFEDDGLRYQTTSIRDQDSRADLQLSFGPEHLEIDYSGNVSSNTLGRMLQESLYTTGHMEGQFKARIYPRHPGSSSVTGALKATNIHQPVRTKHTLHIDELSLKAIDNQLLFEPALFRVDNQAHKLTGSIDIENDGYVLDLVHAATHFSISLPEAPPADTMPRPSESEAFDIWELPFQGRIISRLDSFALGELHWAPFNATVQIDPGNWHYKIEDAAICGVETKGELRVTPEKIAVTLTPAAKEANLDRTMTCLLEKPDLIDGRFDLAGRLETQEAPDKLRRAINGHMEFNASQGRIYRFNLLSKTLAVVNVTEILRGKMPDLMEGGLAYNRIDIRVDIADSLLTIDQAVIDGASANIAGQGTVNLVTGETDMVVLVAPFKTVDALVSYTPIIGDWLGGTLISIPVRVTGAFSDPTVTPLSPTAVGSSLMNLMKRTLNLPVKLVEPLWKRDE